MDLLNVLQLIVTAIVAIWGIYQTRVVSKLEQEIHRLNIQLDQSIQRLHRAREAVIEQHKAHVYLLEYVKSGKDPDEGYFTKHGELSAYKAELRGLAFAIGDQKLLDLVNQIETENENPIIKEMNVRGRSQKLHTRISELLAEATTGK